MIIAGRGGSWKNLSTSVPPDVWALIQKFQEDRKIPETASALRILIGAGLEAAQYWDMGTFRTQMYNAKAWCLYRFDQLLVAAIDMFRSDADLGEPSDEVYSSEEMERRARQADRNAKRTLAKKGSPAVEEPDEEPEDEPGDGFDEEEPEDEDEEKE